MSVQKVRHRIKWVGLTLAAAMLLAGCSANSATEPTEPAATSTSPSAKFAAEATPDSPIASATPTSAKVTWQKVSLANENFELSMPSNWDLKKTKPNEYQVEKGSLASFNVVSDDGKKLAELRTGYPGTMDFPVNINKVANKVFDSESDPDGLLHYTFLSYEGSPDEASISITSLDASKASTYEYVLPEFVYTGGTGRFDATLDAKTKLPTVDASLKGAARFSAYAKTDEYKQLKKLMMSFKTLNPATDFANRESARAAGPCIGAKYTYDLSESGMTCEEAKLFFTKMLEQPISAGAIELPGFGLCKLPFADETGWCDVGATEGTLYINEK